MKYFLFPIEKIEKKKGKKLRKMRVLTRFCFCALKIPLHYLFFRFDILKFVNQITHTYKYKIKKKCKIFN